MGTIYWADGAESRKTLTIPPQNMWLFAPWVSWGSSVIGLPVNELAMQLEKMLRSLNERMYTLEAGQQTALDDLKEELKTLRVIIDLQRTVLAKYQRDTQRRLLICTLAIAALIVGISPFLSDEIKGTAVTAILGWIGFSLTRGEIVK